MIELLMKDRIVIKPGPFVMLKKVLIVEILLAVIIITLSFLTDFLLIYERFPFSDRIPLSLFGIIAFAIIQIIFLVVIFLHWNFELYEVYKDKVIHKKGLFSKSNDIRPFQSLTSIRQRQGLLGKWLNFSSIELEDANTGQVILIPDISRAEEEVENIQGIVNVVEVKTEIKKKDEISKLIKEGENKNLEFKASFRWDIKKGAVNKDMELMIIRSIAAFLNTEGGKLLIGVTDNGKVNGIEEDLKTVKRKNTDGFENHLMTVFTNVIGSEYSPLIDMRFEKFEDKTICVIEIDRSKEPVFFKSNNDEKLYVRAGNSTRELNVREAFKYIKVNFPEYTG